MEDDYFLSKGHLVAKADFFHGSHQQATFAYTNAAPQWQTFNGNNWNSLENDVRTFASMINLDLECYTGTIVSSMHYIRSCDECCCLMEKLSNLL